MIPAQQLLAFGTDTPSKQFEDPRTRTGVGVLALLLSCACCPGSTHRVRLQAHWP
jgi:hypothetical protein